VNLIAINGAIVIRSMVCSVSNPASDVEVTLFQGKRRQLNGLNPTS
jgi:hypothetical protein